LNTRDAGYQVDDYYRYQYPNSYDGRYSDYDAYLNEPNYYDPYRRNASYQYASATIPGLNDLDDYGDWQNVAGYGQAWRPRVDSNWVPYQEGYWTNNYPYGPTWVSSEPWGYAPYHYGRWANSSNQWYWIPEGVNSTPMYAPALVAFVTLGDANQIGWVPLGPGESYAPRYYDDNWQPRYLTRGNVVPGRLINLSIPGAVTVVPVNAWGRAIDPGSIRRIDQQRLASRSATLDPLTLTPLRNAVIHSAWGRGKIDLPPGIAKKLDGTRVYVGGDIRESPNRKGLAQSMRVERVSDNARNQKFKVQDDRDAKESDHRAQQPENGRKQEVDIRRKQETDRATAETARGDRSAERQARQVEQQQRKHIGVQARAPRAHEKAGQPKGQQQPQAERVANPAKHQAQSEVQRPQKVNRAQPEKQRQPTQTTRQNKTEVSRQPQVVSKQSSKARRHEGKQAPAAAPAGQDQAGGGKAKGKEKGKGKP
jgi:hypothetical protein